MEQITRRTQIRKKTIIENPTLKRRFQKLYNQLSGRILREFNAKTNYFSLSLQGSIIGYTQMWRVPLLTIRNGGIIFFAVYALSLLTIANAAAFIEAFTGEYTSKPSIASTDCIPIAKGLAYSSAAYTFFYTAYNLQTTAYSIYYFLNSFRTPIPWMNCPNETLGKTLVCSPEPGVCNKTHLTDICRHPGGYYWSTIVFGEFPKNLYLIESWGVNFGLMEAHVLVWLLAFFALYHDTRITTILACFMVYSFYTILFVLFGLSFRHEGAVDAMKQFFMPDPKHFHMYETYERAMAQALLGMGVGLTHLGSVFTERPPPVPYSRLVTVTALKVLATSLISTMFVYANLGVISHRAGIILKSMRDGPGLFLIALSESTQSIIGESQGLAYITFFLVSCIGSTTMSFLAQGIFGNIRYLYPDLMNNHPVHIGLLCTLSASILGFPVNTKIGYIYLLCFHYFTESYCVLFITGLRFNLISYGYGMRRFCEDVQFKTGWYPNRFYRYVWGSAGFLILGLSTTSTSIWLLAKNDSNQEFARKFKIWSFVLAILLGCIVLAPTVYCGLKCVYASFKAGRILDSLKPNETFGPSDPELMEKRKKFVTNGKVW